VDVVAKHATSQYRKQSNIYLGHSEEVIERIIEKALEKQQKQKL
jgi:hypothetical protein